MWRNTLSVDLCRREGEGGGGRHFIRDGGGGGGGRPPQGYAGSGAVQW